MKKHKSSRTQKRSVKSKKGFFPKLKELYIDSAVSSFRSSIKNWKIMPFSMLSDILFFVSIGFVMGLLQDELVSIMTRLMSFFGQNQSALSTAIMSGSMFEGPMGVIFNMLMNSMGIFFLKLFILLAVTWIIFQGTAWFLAHRAAGSKQSYLKTIGKFSLVTVAAAIVCVIIAFISSKLIFLTGFNPTSVIGFKLISNVTYLLMGIIVYMLIISYAIEKFNVKEIFRIAFKKIFLILPALLFISIILYLILKLIAVIPIMVITLMLLALIVTPLAFLCRAYLIEVIRKIA